MTLAISFLSIPLYEILMFIGFLLMLGIIIAIFSHKHFHFDNILHHKKHNEEVKYISDSIEDDYSSNFPYKNKEEFQQAMDELMADLHNEDTENYSFYEVNEDGSLTEI